jgi:lipoate-protein ligase A
VEHWQFLDTGANTGGFNMRLDETLAKRLAQGSGTPVVRLFQWLPWAVSLGYNQNPADIDASRCARDGIDVVRRPTGGRAILHAEELTYSVVMHAGRRSILQVYNEISRALVRGLALFGVEVALQKSQPDFARAYRQASSIPCFTSSARYEIEHQGRKLVGSAQRRFSDGSRNVVLQHGSILCGPAHRRLVDYLAVDSPGALSAIRREMEEKTTDLSELRGSPVDIANLAEAIRKGFELEWGLTFEDAPLDLRHEQLLPASTGGGQR